MAITISDYIQGLFHLEIVEEVFILETKRGKDEPYSTEYVVSSTDLSDSTTIPPVKDKKFHVSSPCMMFNGMDGFKSEYLAADTNNPLPPESPYEGHRWHIYR